MAFKISSDTIINDNVQFASDLTLVNENGISYITNSGALTSSAAGHELYLGYGSSLVELTVPDVDYSTGVSNLLDFNFATGFANPYSFILKLTGNENRSGFGKSTNTQVASTSPFGTGSEMQSMDVSRDGLHWYFYDQIDNTIKHYTPSTAWAYNSLGGLDGEFTLGAGDDSSGYDGNGNEKIRISENGEYMFRGTPAYLYRYDLSTPWDMSSATLGEKRRWPIQDSDNDAVLQKHWDIKRDGTKIIQTHIKTSFGIGGPGLSYYHRTRLWDLETPWSIDSSSMVLNKKVRYGLRGGAEGIRVSPDNTHILGDGDTLSTTELHKTEWLTPWHLDSTYSNSFGPGTGYSDARQVITTGQQGISHFVVRPGGHYYYGLETNSGPSADFLYLFRIEDSAGNQVPQTFTFPANVHFENGFIEFPYSGQTSYVEFTSIDSGDNWYAKELYKG